MIKVLVADDHAVVREGLKRIINETSDMTVSGEANNGQEVLNKVLAEDWDVVLLDISMPGRGGLEVLRQLRAERPKLPVLILSMHSEDQYAVRVLKTGAAGYITKDSTPEKLVAAIRRVVRGRKYISPAVAEILAFDLEVDHKSDSLHAALSDREYQVLCLMASGKTVSDIAEDLALSVKTISTYRTRILEKLNLKNNAELIRYAIKHELVE
ncbi:MAG: response regulator [Acidobacteriota bacterium]